MLNRALNRGLLLSSRQVQQLQHVKLNNYSKNSINGRAFQPLRAFSTTEDKKKDDTEKEQEKKAKDESKNEESIGSFFSDFKDELSKSLPGETKEAIGGAGKFAGNVKENVGNLGSKVTDQVKEKVTVTFEGDSTSWADAARAVFGLKPKKVEKPSSTTDDAVWYEAKDENTNETYYYNDAGETTWEKPANVKKSAEDEAHEWAESKKEPQPSLLEEQIKELAASIEEIEVAREKALEDSDMGKYKELNKEVRDIRKKIEKLSAQANTTAVVHVEKKKGAWEQFSDGLRGSQMMGTLFGIGDRVGATDAARNLRDKAEDAREAMETSQNPLVYSAYSLWDSMFAENEMGEAIRAFRKLDPNFTLEGFLEEMEEDIIPTVLGAFLKGDKDTLNKYCTEGAAAATGAAIGEREAAGMRMDPNILAIQHAQIAAAKVVDKLGPLIVVQFMAQQIDCLYDKKGAVVQGKDDQVQAVFYAFAMEQFYNEDTQIVEWKVKEFVIAGTVPWI